MATTDMVAEWRQGRERGHRHLRYEPDRPSRSRIKRLRGEQDATFRLRVGDYRIFYDVGENTVIISAVLHKRETEAFYREQDL